ncbi:BBP7 family outer membrane beta-barrel protein [Novipirellula galeiformis]|nr:BBP7 family outer membrane beta-barrel protein [Novipirellula galeiformis]
MLSIRTLSCFTLGLAALLATTASAQNSPTGTSSVRKNERTARANWQPVRTSHSTDADASYVGEESTNRRVVTKPNSRSASNSPVRQASHVQRTGHGIPSPSYPPHSIIEEPIIHESIDGGYVDLEPIHGGSMACDAMPGGFGCGCGSMSCDGGCDSMGSCGHGGSCDGSCGGNGWRPCLTLCLPQDGWVSFEYLSWWQDGMSLPPLVTTSTNPNVARADAGVLGKDTTRVLFGGEEVLTDSFDGGRLRMGVWLDKCHTWAIAGEYFKIGSESESYFGNSNGNPVLARPFFNVTPSSGIAREDSELVAYNGTVTGSVSATAESELLGAGIHFRNLRATNQGCNTWGLFGCPQQFTSRTEALIGYRHLQLTEGVMIQERLTGINPVGNFVIDDQFATRNQFNGVDIGWVYSQNRGCWTLDGSLRLGIGTTHQTVSINGQTTISGDPNSTGSQTLPGGLLAQESNIGQYKRDEFSVVPEFNVNLGYRIHDNWRVMVGYTFLYWSNVVRPGEQISLDVNPNQLPPAANPMTGPARPHFAFDSVDYWAQGISTGLEYRW